MKQRLRDQIRGLDPVRDHQRIVYLDVCFEFPFDTTRALEFALFRTYCVPGISALLDRTGEFARCPQKRYDDTDLIVSEMMEWGYDSARGSAALARMNRIHGHFRIANEDFLYVLSTFVFEPIRWNARFGWRTMKKQLTTGFTEGTEEGNFRSFMSHPTGECQVTSNPLFLLRALRELRGLELSFLGSSYPEVHRQRLPSDLRRAWMISTTTLL